MKPENILFRKQGKIFDLIISDFGLATFKNDSDILFKKCGTPGYVAPEILKYKVFNYF